MMNLMGSSVCSLCFWGPMTLAEATYDWTDDEGWLLTDVCSHCRWYETYTLIRKWSSYDS